MKNKIFIFFFYFISILNLNASNIQIQAKNITLDKDQETTIFKNQVIVKSEDKIIESDFVEYNKKKGFLVLKDNIKVIDLKNNIIEASYAEYDENKKIFTTQGPTYFTSSEKYVISTKDLFFDNFNKIIKTDKSAVIYDQDDNKIFLEKFEYFIKDNIFKSIGFIKIEDKFRNIYEFSQVYIDTKKKEILGTDIKTFINQEDFKIDKKNKPRIFSNSAELKDKKTKFIKSVFTLCDYREGDKCPPWTIQASKMMHDAEKKTIFYDNAIIKIYDIPIFYLPKLSHPDPSVKRRSGFLPPTISSSKNLGNGFSIPYFFAFNGDKNFTFINKFYARENPLFLGEYHQAFKTSSFLADFGYTEGYKNTSATKKSGNKSHLFTKFIKNFQGENGSENTLSFSTQEVSKNKYLKLYKIKSNLVDYNKDTLENNFNFIHETKDMFFGLRADVFETLKDNYNDKYEYILPEVTLDKNLFSNNKYGTLDLQTNLKIHNYDTNKFENFFTNDFDWSSNDIFFKSGIKSQFLGNIKNINYETKNVDIYKKDPTSEIYGSLGFLSEIFLEKNEGNIKRSLIPKFLARYSPGSMRKEDKGSRLNPASAFSINRIDNNYNYETGLTGTVGFDFTIEEDDKKFDLSIAQIVSEKENKKMHSKTSLDEKLSDLTGSAKYEFNQNISLDYKFLLDQNYKDLNFNEIGTNMNFGPTTIDFSFLQEKKHIGNQEFFKTKFNYENKESGLFSFEVKRNLITNSSEFYNLSYEYINDCLRAGLVYRREFYNDSELEPENSLLFKITLTPFGQINSPTFNK